VKVDFLSGPQPFKNTEFFNTICPLRTFSRSSAERKITKYSGRSRRQLTGKSPAEMDIGTESHNGAIVHVTIWRHYLA